MNRAVPGNRLGAGDPCPFCGATGGVSETEDGTYICLVCGQPRVLIEGGVPRAFGEKRWLLRSKALKLKRAAWTVAGGVTAAAALFFSTVVGLIQWSIGLPSGWLTFALSVALMPLLVSIFAFSRAKLASKQSANALEKAEATVAQEVLRAGGPEVDAAELARKLRVPVARAEELLALAQVEKFLAEPLEDGAGAPPAAPDANASEASPPKAAGERSRSEPRGQGPLDQWRVDPTAENPVVDELGDTPVERAQRRTR